MEFEWRNIEWLTIDWRYNKLWFFSWKSLLNSVTKNLKTLHFSFEMSRRMRSLSHEERTYTHYKMDLFGEQEDPWCGNKYWRSKKQNRKQTHLLKFGRGIWCERGRGKREKRRERSDGWWVIRVPLQWVSKWWEWRRFFDFWGRGDGRRWESGGRVRCLVSAAVNSQERVRWHRNKSWEGDGLHDLR